MEEYNRRGKFVIPGKIMRDGNMPLLLSVMKDVVVYHAEPNYFDDTITYYVYHPSFDYLELGQIAPEYEALITYQMWNKDEITVTWRKKDQ